MKKELDQQDYATLKELSEWLDVPYKNLYNKARCKNWQKYIDRVDLLVLLPTRKKDKFREQLVAHYLVGDVIKFLD